MNDNSLAFICAILAVALAFVGMILPEPNNGINGTDGINGSQGEQGIQGIQGIIGYNGSQGIQGIQGEMGATGATGAQGIAGVNGTDAPSITLMNGLVCWLPLNDGIGNASDYSGYMNHGVIYGASWVDGKFGKALSFDGSNDYVDLGNVLNVGNNDFSFSLWVKSFVNAPSNAYLMAKQGSTYVIFRITSGHFEIYIYDGVDGVNIDSTTSVVADVQYYVTATCDRDSTTGLKLYVNSVLEVTGNPIAIGNLDNTANFQIGAFASVCNLFNGILDDIRDYERVLTQTEIILLYTLS